MARVLVVVNPMAARTGSDKLHSVEDAFRSAGWSVDTRETRQTGDAEEFARAAAADGNVDVVAPYGGDGTMIEVVTGVRGTEIPVGLLPGGTGNVLSGNLRLPRDPVEAAKRITRETGRRSVDLGRFREGDAERFFAIACGAGFEARLMETPSAAKKRWGLGAYFARGVKLLNKVENVDYRIVVDGKDYEYRAATVTIANCAEIIPPFFSLKEAIELDDGFLDVVLVSADGPGHAAVAAWQLLTRKTDGSKLVSHLRGREISVVAETPQPTGLDGEVVGLTPFTADLLPGALQVVAPASSG